MPASDGYITITARAYGEVDPTHPLNAIIQDIRLASGNVRGMIEYSMDFTIFRPPDGGNGLLFYEVVNRGWPLSAQLQPGASNRSLTSAGTRLSGAVGKRASRNSIPYDIR